MVEEEEKRGEKDVVKEEGRGEDSRRGREDGRGEIIVTNMQYLSHSTRHPQSLQ